MPLGRWWWVESPTNWAAAPKVWEAPGSPLCFCYYAQPFVPLSSGHLKQINKNNLVVLDKYNIKTRPSLSNYKAELTFDACDWLRFHWFLPGVWSDIAAWCVEEVCEVGTSLVAASPTCYKKFIRVQLTSTQSRSNLSLKMAMYVMEVNLSHKSLNVTYILLQRFLKLTFVRFVKEWWSWMVSTLRWVGTVLWHVEHFTATAVIAHHFAGHFVTPKTLLITVNHANYTKIWDNH